MLTKTLRLAGCACIALLLLLSLLPAQDMVRTGAPKGVEHFAAYFLSAIVLSIGAPRRTKIGIVLGFSALAAAMEGLQHLSPGRTPHLSDFLASSSGALVGVIVATVALTLFASRLAAR